MIENNTMGLIVPPLNQFEYSADVNYEFETAVMEEEKTDCKLLFIRIDAYDPAGRETNKPDYCIPLAFEGATDYQKLTWTVPFGGAWSDTREVVLMVFDDTWIPWFKGISKGLAFSNPNSRAACCMTYSAREQETISLFCQ